MLGMNFMYPFLFAVVWLVVVIYLLTLATRLVAAVERIADRLGNQQLRPGA